MRTRRSWMIILIIMLGFVVVSQVFSYLIRSTGGFYFCNDKIAFNLPLIQPWWGIIVFSILFFVILELEKNNDWNKKSLGLILILTGASQNLVDRLIFDCVMDFIQLPFWPIFNLGDIAIILGIFLLILSCWPAKK